MIKITKKQKKILNNALINHELGKIEIAENEYKRLLKSMPNNALILTNLGNILLYQKKIKDGLKLLKKSLSISKNQPFTYYNCGNALRDLGRIEEALCSYDKAILIKPDYADAHYNRGNVLKLLGRFEEAIISYDKAIYNKPNYISAYWNKGLTKLLLGDYEEGWELFEYRWKRLTFANANFVRNISKPLWLGEVLLEGKSILITSEQGYGDFIQFIRYISLLEKLGANIIIEVPLPLIELIKNFKFINNPIFVEKWVGELPHYDFYCPIMSLPLAFKTRLDTIPNEIPYLYAYENKKLKWKLKLGKKIIPRIGIVLSGSSNHENDLNRSIAFEKFQIIFDLPVEFHCLQNEIRSNDINFIANNPFLITTHQHALNDFSDTAALITEMDLVISVDTSVAHLAGSLGKLVCILLPYTPDPRWMLERDDSPWYPTAILFRQNLSNNWESVIDKLKKHIVAEFLL